MFQKVIYYAAGALWKTAILLFGMLPFGIAALLMQYLSHELRRRMSVALGVRVFVWITAPGVVVHELSHAVACFVFGHRIVGISLFSPEENGTLGYVRHEFNHGNPFHRIGNFFIGTAPIYGGVLMLGLLSVLLLPAELRYGDLPFAMLSSTFWQRWQSWLYLYASTCVASHITLSREDLSGALNGIVALLGLILLFEFFTAWDRGIQIAVNSAISKLFLAALPSLTVAAVLMSILILLLPKK